MLERIKEDIECVFDRDPAARTRFEVLTTYPGVHAVIGHRLSHGLWRRRWKWLARFIAMLFRWFTGVEIHPGAKIGRRLFIDHGMGVVIGETAEIGDDCTIYHGVTLGGTTWRKGKRHPTLGNNVIVGAGAKVLGPITLAEGARVGSNAVVVKDVPAASTVTGIPARVVSKVSSQGDDERRHAMAKKIGFDAYGVTQEMPDPVAHAINCLLDHMHALDGKVESMSQAIRDMGGQVSDEPLPDLDAQAIKAALPDETIRQ
ncbi:MAG: serine O-acetyltransferase [Halothiobacillaceae bacterium]|nr:MAG: serine O-acetyltransferase [Halothiobacillaceae bacterium]